MHVFIHTPYNIIDVGIRGTIYIWVKMMLMNCILFYIIMLYICNREYLYLKITFVYLFRKQKNLFFFILTQIHMEKNKYGYQSIHYTFLIDDDVYTNTRIYNNKNNEKVSN